MSNYSNLLKAGWVMVDESEKRIIDNNELVNKKIEAHQEEEAKRQMAEQQENNNEENFFDGFSEGIGYDQIDAYDDSQNIIGAQPPMDYEGDDFQSMNMENGTDPSIDYSGEMTGEMPEGYEFEENTEFAGEGDLSEMNIEPEPIPEPEPEPAMEVPQINLEEIQAQIDEQLRMADEQAQQMIADANAQADQIISQAEEAKNQAVEEGRQAGYDEGYQKGVEEAEQMKAAAAAEIEEEKEKLQADFQQLVNSIEPDMVNALTGIYEHVFNVEFKDNKQIILHLIRNTLGKMESGINIIVHVSADDYDLVTDEKTSLEEALASPNSTLEFIEDPLLKENECIIESEGGVFDCSLGVELSELSRKLKLLSYDRSKR